jgi:hypothetical protein
MESIPIQSTATGLQTNANAGISNKCKFNYSSKIHQNADAMVLVSARLRGISELKQVTFLTTRTA